MTFRTLFVSLSFAALLANAGCVRLATAPLRAERREKAEAGFERLAQVPPETIAARLNQRMTTELQLTATQQTQVAAINLKYANELHAVAAGPESVREKVRALRDQADAKSMELKAILTSDQFARFETLKAELREMAEQTR